MSRPISPTLRGLAFTLEEEHAELRRWTHTMESLRLATVATYPDAEDAEETIEVTPWGAARPAWSITKERAYIVVACLYGDHPRFQLPTLNAALGTLTAALCDS